MPELLPDDYDPAWFHYIDFDEDYGIVGRTHGCGCCSQLYIIPPDRAAEAAEAIGKRHIEAATRYAILAMAFRAGIYENVLELPENTEITLQYNGPTPEIDDAIH